MSLYGPHFMLLLSITVLLYNVTYTYPVSCRVIIKLFQIVSKLFQLFQGQLLTTVSNAKVYRLMKVDATRTPTKTEHSFKGL